jgi:hypothetical protein
MGALEYAVASISHLRSQISEKSDPKTQDILGGAASQGPFRVLCGNSAFNVFTESALFYWLLDSDS